MREAMRDDDCIIIYQENRKETAELSFLDILLDETLIYGTVCIPWKCFEKVSTINRRLPGKQIYELLLRLAEVFPVYLTGEELADAKGKMVLESREEEVSFSELQADCYIISRYKKILLEQQLFDNAVEGVLGQAKLLGCDTEMVEFLSDMLKESDDYRRLYLGSQPFLIHTGDTVCYNILSVFAGEMGNALRRRGYLVEYFDVSKESFLESVRFMGQSFQAVIGFQNVMFSAKMVSGQFLHDRITGPKYNYIFDHPVFLDHFFREVPRELTLFTVDKGYAEFAKKHYPLDAIFFPPGGMIREFCEKKRVFDVVFIGSNYDNVEEIRELLWKMSREKRFLINRFCLMMRKYPHLPAEQLLALALEYYGISLSEEGFLDQLHEIRPVIFYMMYYFRRKIIESLVESGIKVDVFGESWAGSKLCQHPNFVWHKQDLSAEECLLVWQQSKIALNIMSWHKNALTERILNSMLQKAVVLTERNPYMEEEFEEGREVVFYDLARLEKLPELVSSLLGDEKRLRDIAERGYQRAKSSHTWDCRVGEFLALLDRGCREGCC